MLYAYQFQTKKTKSVLQKRLSTGLMLVGLVLILLVAYPIASWQLVYLMAGPNLLTPIAGPSAQVLGAVSAFNGTDDTNLNSWFAGSPPPVDPLLPKEELFYNITIPKVGIKQAVIDMGGEDLKKSLIAWPNSVKPGQPGEVIVFGHSALPSFYNPASYTTIFTHIYDLDYGEKVYLDYDGIRYTYEIESKKVIPPTDLSILEQHYDAPRIVMITCLPAGTLLLRGVVTARLVAT